MISLYVVQATTRCNLDCSYCYLPASSRKAFDKMPPEILRKASRLVLMSSLMPPSLTILWHAGEPLAAGLQFFEEAVSIVDECNVHSKQIGHSIQTNATMINDRWCQFFAANEFEVGVSVDGPEFLHDRYRRGWHGQGSFAATMKGVESLRGAGLKYGAICVLTADSLGHPDEIFDFFVDNGFHSIAFNVEEIEAAHRESTLLDESRLEALCVEYQRFMTRMLERWVRSAGAVHIREFNSMANKIVAAKHRRNYVPMLDVSQGLQTITVRTDGSIVSYSPELATGIPGNSDAFVIGNVDDIGDLEDVMSDERYLQIRQQIKSGIARCEATCAYFQLCGGGWPSNKYAEHGTFDVAETKSCLLHTQILADVVIEGFTSRPEFAEAIEAHVSHASALE